jgi:hypothetical protein
MKFYAGIGSRKTPADICRLMTAIAVQLAIQGWTLRSGHAKGADQAFEAGAANDAQVFVPWASYNDDDLHLAREVSSHVPEHAFEIAQCYHPAWSRCSNVAKLLHARNSQIVFGEQLDTPVRFILCWHEGSGGTMQACRIANDRGIEVFNLADATTRARVMHGLDISELPGGVLQMFTRAGIPVTWEIAQDVPTVRDLDDLDAMVAEHTEPS